MWHDTFIGNSVAKGDSGEQIDGIISNLKQLLKMRIISSWDFTIQCDRMIEARRSDILLVDKKNKEVKIMEIAVPGDSRVKEKELEKIEKYQYLREEIGHICRHVNSGGRGGASRPPKD